MMSLSSIRHLSDEAAKQARKSKVVPLILGDAADVDHLGAPGYRIPNLGSHVPKGWKMLDHWMCDASGVGADWEPALTQAQLKTKIKGLISEGKLYGYAVVEQGSFQVVLGVFEKQGRKRGIKPRPE